MGNTLLTTVVFACVTRKRCGRSVDIGEEFANPFGELGLIRAVGNYCDVVLGVGGGSEVCNGLLVDVLVEGSRGCWVEWCSEASVEGKTVSRVDGKLRHTAEDLLLRESEELLDLFIVFVGYPRSEQHL